MYTCAHTYIYICTPVGYARTRIKRAHIQRTRTYLCAHMSFLLPYTHTFAHTSDGVCARGLDPLHVRILVERMDRDARSGVFFCFFFCLLLYMFLLCFLFPLICFRFRIYVPRFPFFTLPSCSPTV